METNICMGCLSTGSNIKIISQTFKEIFFRLFPDHETQDICMCESCSDFLNQIVIFREKCIETSIHLKKIKQEKDEEQIVVEPLMILSAPVKNEKVEKSKGTKIKIEPMYKCDECHLEFKHKTKLLSHIKTHQKFTCKMCPASFDTSKDLNAHKKSHPVPKNYMCDICSACFKLNCDLKSHFARHHAVKQLPCIYSDCPKTFSTQRLLKVHIKTHKKVKRKDWMCDLCGTSYTTKRKLRDHIERIHLKIKEAYTKVCPHCGRYFTNSHFLEHLRRHTGEKNFKCKTCGMLTVTRQALQRHEYSHSNTKPYYCKLCSTGYYNPKYLRNHYSKVHNSEYLGYIKYKPT